MNFLPLVFNSYFPLIHLQSQSRHMHFLIVQWSLLQIASSYSNIQSHLYFHGVIQSNALMAFHSIPKFDAQIASQSRWSTRWLTKYIAPRSYHTNPLQVYQTEALFQENGPQLHHNTPVHDKYVSQCIFQNSTRTWSIIYCNAKVAAGTNRLPSALAYNNRTYRPGVCSFESISGFPIR